MARNNKSLLELRIEKFCQSSGELLAEIQTRYNCLEKSASKGINRRRKKDIISIPDLGIDFRDDEPLEELS